MCEDDGLPLDSGSRADRMLGLRGTIGLMAGSGPTLLKRKRKFQKFMTTFPERAEFYTAEIEKMEEKLKAMNACQRCGRPLKGTDSMERGYGPECMKRIKEHDE
jgi:hypothetical protein